MLTWFLAFWTWKSANRNYVKTDVLSVIQITFPYPVLPAAVPVKFILLIWGSALNCGMLNQCERTAHLYVCSRVRISFCPNENTVWEIENAPGLQPLIAFETQPSFA